MPEGVNAPAAVRLPVRLSRKLMPGAGVRSLAMLNRAGDLHVFLSISSSAHVPTVLCCPSCTGNAPQHDITWTVT